MPDDAEHLRDRLRRPDRLLRRDRRRPLPDHAARRLPLPGRARSCRCATASAGSCRTSRAFRSDLEAGVRGRGRPAAAADGGARLPAAEEHRLRLAGGGGGVGAGAGHLARDDLPVRAGARSRRCWKPTTWRSAAQLLISLFEMAMLDRRRTRRRHPALSARRRSRPCRRASAGSIPSCSRSWSVR